MSKVDYDIKLDFADVLIKPRRSAISSRNDVSLTRKFDKFNMEFVPIISSNMDTVTNFKIGHILAKHKMMAAIPKHFAPEDWMDFANELGDEGDEVLKHLIVTMGMDDLAKVRNIFGNFADDNEPPFLCVDVANGYSSNFSDFVRRMREEFPKKIIMAGNVVTPEMVEELLLDGADIIKIGIGPGSVCQTRLKTGIGFPQLSAILECSQAAHANNGLICSDGGIVSPGDLGKAFGAGADFIMAGNLFAGHDESPGEVVEKDGKRYKMFYGMASKEAQNRYNKGLADYRASEGKCVHIPCRGPIEETIKDLLGSLRSCCSYTNCHQIEQLAQNVSFIRVNNQLNQSLAKYDAPAP